MRPATIAIVVGREAAHTPSRLSTLVSFNPAATISGGIHSKQGVRPGYINWKWQLTESSLTPASNQTCEINRLLVNTEQYWEFIVFNNY